MVYTCACWVFWAQKVALVRCLLRGHVRTIRLEPLLSKPRILIVEDEYNVRDALDRWFTLRGFEADEAEDGTVAVEKCRKSTYDVITMDLEMPKMNGIEAISHIRKIHPKTPIVVLTGFLPEPSGFSMAGVTQIVTKPVPLRELETIVRKVLPVTPSEEA